MNTQPTPHKHAAKIIKWAQDTSLPVWGWSQGQEKWVICENAFWSSNAFYELGEKPTAPPQKMCTLGGLEFPMPETVAPEVCQEVFYVTTSKVHFLHWDNEANHQKWLHDGCVHLTAANANMHLAAIQAANQQSIKDAK